MPSGVTRVARSWLCGITRRWSGPRRRYTSPAVERRACAAAAAQRPRAIHHEPPTMLVLLRKPGESIVIGNPESHWVVTVLNVRHGAASFKISHSGGFDSRVVDLDQGLTAHVGTTAEFRLIEVREDPDRVRI